MSLKWNNIIADSISFIKWAVGVIILGFPMLLGSWIDNQALILLEIPWAGFCVLALFVYTVVDWIALKKSIKERYFV
jgi:membrane protein DedA with SNARE-associated domain